MERAGYAQPLAKADPQVHGLLATVNPDLVSAVLDRSLTDQHLPVIDKSEDFELAATVSTRGLGHNGKPVFKTVRGIGYQLL